MANARRVMILASSLLTACVTLNSISVFAEGKHEGAASHAPSTNTPGAIDTCKPCTRKGAFQASEGRIVLHYGEGIRDVAMETQAMALSQEGYPTVAVPGGSPNTIEMFVGEKIIGKFNQNHLYNGQLGMIAADYYNIVIKKAHDPNLKKN